MERIQDLKNEMEVMKKYKPREGSIWKIWVNNQELQRQV